MRTRLILSSVALSLALSGCANMTQTERDTFTGAGIGAVGGALIGSATGHTGEGAVIGAALGGTTGYIWSNRMEQQRMEMQQATYGSGVQVRQTRNNQLMLLAPGDASFSSGSDQISPRFAQILDRLATSLNQNSNTDITIVGHTDSTGTDAVNLPLSRHRARSVGNYLVNRGVSPNRIVVEGRGSREPIASNATFEGRAQNRRVEIFVAEPAQHR